MIWLVAVLVAASSQHQHHEHQAQPYAGLEEREIKALSPEDTRALEAGEGMGFALAAELNRFPGPKHVLELAEILSLTEEQRARTEAIFAAMRDDAVRLGGRVLELERKLDAAFASNDPGQAQNAESVALEIGRLRGELRWTHLEAHVAMRRVLSEEQVELYRRHRGYAAH